MKQTLLPVFIVAATIMFCRPGLLQAQEKAPDVAGVSSQQASESDIQWLWGEVSSVAVEKNEAVVKYLDYEADVEKDMTVAVTDKTTYENIKGLGELKPQDTVSIDYVVTDGKSIAKNISVEKPEVMPAAEAPVAASTTVSSSTPADAAPMADAPKDTAAPVEMIAPIAEATAPVMAPASVEAPVAMPAPTNETK